MKAGKNGYEMSVGGRNCTKDRISIGKGSSFLVSRRAKVLQNNIIENASIYVNDTNQRTGQTLELWDIVHRTEECINTVLIKIVQKLFGAWIVFTTRKEFDANHSLEKLRHVCHY
jgi:hypothetical protein